jgi:D-xylonolactonase
MQALCQGYGLIEGPVWDPTRGLLFSDVLFGGIYALSGTGEVSEVIPHRKGIGGMALHANGAGLVVSGRNIAFKPFANDATKTLLDRDEANGIVGFNDITTDSKGRVYAGSLGSSPVFDDGREPRSGDLYLIDLDGSSRQVAQDIQLTNGLGFSPDGKILYHSDSTRRSVFCYDVQQDGGLGDKRLFSKTPKGVPDGLVVSVDGAVWVALAGGGGGVAVFEPDGQLREQVTIPQPMCTSVCFGGDDLQDLYIVSGSDGSPGDHAGAVYCHRSPVPGVAVTPATVPI